MVYLYAFMPFTLAVLTAVFLFSRVPLNLYYIRKILWTISLVSFMVTLVEVIVHVVFGDNNPVIAEEMLYAIYINAPTVILVAGISVLVQFVNFTD
jgi:hypothetical protein